MARLSCKPGTIVAIPLTDGRFAFAKVFADSMLGVYDWVSPSVPPLAQVLGQAFAFHQATTLVAITRGDWPTLGVEPFACEDDAWPPDTREKRANGPWVGPSCITGSRSAARPSMRSGVCTSSPSAPSPRSSCGLIEDILIHRLGEQHRVRID